MKMYFRRKGKGRSRIVGEDEFAEENESDGDEVDLIFEKLKSSNKNFDEEDKKNAHTNKDTPALPPILPFKIQGEFVCLNCRTALLLPFKWSDPTTADLKEWIHQMLKRKVPNHAGAKVPLYKENQDLPDAVADLDPHFRKTLGWDEEEHSSDGFESYGDGHKVQETEVCMRLMATAEALQILFPSPSLVGNKEGQHVYQRVKIEEIEVVAFPLGTAVLKVIINWIPEANSSLTLDEFRTWLYLSKFRRKVESFDGWLLDRSPHLNPDAITIEQQKYLGARLCNALYRKLPVSLTTIGNWMLMSVLESPDKTPHRLGSYAKRCYHHSAVVIDKKPNSSLLKEYLFHLKRAYGQKNRPPPLTMGDERQNTDRILRPRSNRYIGMSREGTVSLSWPGKIQRFEDYEVRKWHKVFLGIYLILAIQIQGEKSMLLELSNLSAHAGSLLKQKLEQISEKRDEILPEVAKLRTQLASLAVLMTQYTLQMSSDDCGGKSEYIEFFTAQRNIMGIRSQRNELREEIQDVLALVESSYREEQRKFSTLVYNFRKSEKKSSKARDQEIFSSRSSYQTMTALISIFALPPIILGGLFGMNLDDLPREVPFYPALGASLCLSMILFIIFMFINLRNTKKQKMSVDPPERLDSFSFSRERPSFWEIKEKDLD
eukprot:TRINITY_DN1613_c0_g1_i7.p1 TRINITY_DN1613_c0_g1~~TRINITY_DN1613_c0_g1_i7.p1  ORF type:complete len:659 (+),score=110.64 TRINITY_DN1613_c0_g1_i7:27-2003(+)